MESKMSLRKILIAQPRLKTQENKAHAKRLTFVKKQMNKIIIYTSRDETTNEG